jgi:hypothetical protein
MSLSAIIEKLTGLFPDAANTSAVALGGTDAQLLARVDDCTPLNLATLTTTTAMAERIVFRAKQKCRVVRLNVLPNAALTGDATDSATLLIDKRAATDYTTAVNLSTYATDTVTTDNLVAFTPKDIGPASSYSSATATVWDLEVGDVITAEITKQNSGVTWPIADLHIQLEPRD